MATWPPKVGKATSKRKKTWKLSSRLYETTIFATKRCRPYHVEWPTGCSPYLLPSRQLGAKTCKKSMEHNMLFKNVLKTIEKSTLSKNTRGCCIWPTKKLAKSFGNIVFLRQGVSLLCPLFAWGAQMSNNNDHITAEGGKGNVEM